MKRSSADRSDKSKKNDKEPNPETPPHAPKLPNISSNNGNRLHVSISKSQIKSQSKFVLKQTASRMHTPKTKDSLPSLTTGPRAPSNKNLLRDARKQTAREVAVEKLSTQRNLDRKTSVLIHRRDSKGHAVLDDKFAPVAPIKMTKKDFKEISTSSPAHFIKKRRETMKCSVNSTEKVPMAKIIMASQTVGRVNNGEMTGATKHYSLHKVKEEVTELVYVLMDKYEIQKEKVVRNIVTYCKSMTTPKTTIIEKNTFVAQMVDTFGITDMFLLDQIFSTRKIEFQNCLAMEEFAGIICIFASPEFIYRAMFAFNAYDFDRNDKIGLPEYNRLLFPCVAHMTDDDHDSEQLDNGPGTTIANNSLIEELALILMTLFGKTLKDANISRYEWYHKVREDELLVECLGSCLPLHNKLERFMEVMNCDDPYHVARVFSRERKRCLGMDVELPSDEVPLYPVTLEVE